jgi:RNA polymerase sigma-70 factor (ECF subfamily)
MKSKNQKDIHADLIELCIKQNPKAQHQIYDLYAHAMFNVARRITNNDEDARDVLQEAFVDAFSKLETFRFNSSFGTWLRRIVINKCINLINKKQVLTTELEKVSYLDLVEESDEEFTWNVETKILKEAIKELPLGVKTVLNLYVFEGYKHQEIAEILSISISTSKAQYSKAKQRLKYILLPSFEQTQRIQRVG